MNTMLSRCFLALAAGMFISCSAAADEGELTVLGPDGGYTYFKGDLNMNLMSNCGEATAQATGDSSGSSSPELWDIESYFIFTYGEYIFTRFTYSKSKTSYTLSPSTTSTSTCSTIDGIHCNSSGTWTCETADNVNCGGTKSFIFAGGSPYTVFQAVTGTIDYQIDIDSDSGTVNSADLEFDMIDSQGRILEGEVHCTAP